jgi:lysozyme family protein
MNIEAAFLVAWAATKREEQGYVDNKKDRGGPTNHGITEAVARANGFQGDMKDLPIETAREIAKVQYWDIMNLDRVSVLSLPIALELFDSGFLCGTGESGQFLQYSLNVLNREQSMYGDLKVDGIVGSMSIYNLRLFLEARSKDKGEEVMLKALNVQQGAYLFKITEGRKANEEFFFGWLANRIKV